jgi:hypothetical protein
MKKFYKNFIENRVFVFKVVVFVGLMVWGGKGWGQTTVTVGGGTSITCPVIPTATWTTPPAGVTFSNWSRGSGVSCATANDGLSGSGFNSSSAAASFTGNKYYSVTLTADASHTFSLNQFVWTTQLSGSTNSCNFTLQYRNNGGALTSFGTAAQSIASSGAQANLMFTGSVLVTAGTSIILYLVPHEATAAGTTVRWMNGSSVSVTSNVLSNPNLTNTGSTGHGSICTNASQTPITYTITNSGTVQADGIAVISSDPQFVVSGLSSISIPSSGGTATYNVTFTPTSAGVKTSVITITSTTSGSNSPTSTLNGTGTSAVLQTVTTNAATSALGTSATLNGNLTAVGACPATIEKGFVYSLASTNPDPLVNGVGVTKASVATVSTGNYTLGISGLTTGVSYAYKAYIYDGTSYTYGTTVNFSTVSVPPTLLPALNATVDAPFIISFVDDPVWGAAITGISVGGYSLPGVAFSVGIGSITFAPSASTYLQASGSLNITVLATGYSNAMVTQAVNPGVPYSISVTTQPSAPGANGGNLTSQPAVQVRDRYGNNVSSGLVVNVAVTSGQSTSWNLGGSLTANTNTSGIASFTGLSASNLTNAVYSASLTFTTAVGSALVNSSFFSLPVGSLSTDYFKSISSGNWSTAANWQSSHDGLTWFTPANAPNNTANNITIQANNSLTIASNVTLDQLIIKSGGALITGTGTLTINNGAGDDLVVESGGVFRHTSSIPNFNGNATMSIQSGGMLEVLSVSDAPSNYATISGPGLAGTSVLWADSSIFNWNIFNGQFLTSGVTYFPANTAVPIFRVSMDPGTVGGGTSTTINGILEVHSSFTFSGGAAKNFRNGIRGRSDATAVTLTQNTTSGNSFNIFGPNAILSGNNLKIVLNSPLNLTSSVTIPTGAKITISGGDINNNTAGNILTVNGTLDVTVIEVTNTNGAVVVNGTYRTAHAGGFLGVNSSIPSGSTSNVALNSGSTVEYYASGEQAVQGSTAPAYSNIILSGSGTKTLTSTNAIASGTVTIKDTATFNIRNHSFGTSATLLVMSDTSRLRVAGASVKPDMGGIYTLGAKTTIQFDSTFATQIRLAPVYSNIVVNGTNVSTSSTATGLNIRSGGTFTVNNGATFKVTTAAGFSGSTSTAINNTNNPTITLVAGSTIDYWDASQSITNSTSYQNFAISGTGDKTAPAGTLTVKGNFSKSNTSVFKHNDGLLLVDGTAEQIFSNTSSFPIEFNNVTISNSGAGLTVNSDSLAIVKELLFTTGAKLNFGTGNIILRSTAARTANVGPIIPTVSIDYLSGPGRFIVERYIQTGGKWQYLSVPTDNAQTIKDAWQEGLSDGTTNTSGYGMHITGPTYPTSGNFDAHTQRHSIKVYDSTAYDGWSVLGNTNTAFSSYPIMTGFMAFVRSNRAGDPVSAAGGPTTLRTKGKLFTGTQTSIAVPAYDLPVGIGNPFASPVDLTKIRYSDNQKFYLWDPKMAGFYGVGGYQTHTYNTATGSYDLAAFSPLYGAGGSSYTSPNNYVQSGQAFFTMGAATPGTLVFEEGDKASAGYGLVSFAPVADNNGYLRANLLGMQSGRPVLSDGILVNFGSQYRNSVDDQDAIKFGNSGENLALKRDGNWLSVERHENINGEDTLFLEQWGTKTQAYRWEVICSKLNSHGIQGWLIDKNLNKQHPLNLNGSTYIDITIEDNALSRASDRFMIIFKQRVKSPGPSKDSSLVDIMTTPLGKKKLISVYPNPVVNESLQLLLENFRSGNYTLELSNQQGQLLFTRPINVGAASERKLVVLPNSLPAGTYQLSISGLGALTEPVQVVVQ